MFCPDARASGLAEIAADGSLRRSVFYLGAGFWRKQGGEVLILKYMFSDIFMLVWEFVWIEVFLSGRLGVVMLFFIAHVFLFVLLKGLV